MGRFNMPLYQLRESTGLSQEAFGRKMAGYNAHTVMRIENGISGGKLDFWAAVQDYFGIPNERYRNRYNEGGKRSWIITIISL